MLELKNLEHENITVIVSSRWAKLDFTWLVNKTVEKNVVFRDFDVLFLKCSDKKMKKIKEIGCTYHKNVLFLFHKKYFYAIHLVFE